MTDRLQVNLNNNKMDLEKPDNVLTKIDQQRQHYLERKRLYGEMKPRSSFMTFCEERQIIMQQYFSHLSPAERSAHLWEEYQRQNNNQLKKSVCL